MSSVRRWLEHPRVGLSFLTPGQRYTAVISVLFALSVVAFGVPRGSSSALGPALVTNPSAVKAQLVPSASPAQSVVRTSQGATTDTLAVAPPPDLSVLTTPTSTSTTTTTSTTSTTSTTTTTTTPCSSPLSGLPPPLDTVACATP